MRYQRILLVNPPHSGFLGIGYEPNISLGYLSETLESCDIEHDIFDMALGYDESMLWQKIESYKPDLVGITMVTLDYLDTLKLITRLKQRFNVDVVIGGAHMSCMRQELLEEYPEINYGVVLEGESALVELCSNQDLSTIKGLLYRHDSQVVFTGEREFCQDLDNLPFPKYRKFELQKYLKRSIGIVTSRGCPHQCIYCPVRLTIGNKIRLRSAENVVKEISYWYFRGYRAIDIWDDNFTISSKRVHQFCDLLIDSQMKDLILNLPNGVRADRVDRELLKKMKETGFRKIAFGVEGGNNQVLKQLKKGARIETIERAIKEACELGFDVILFFLIGSPGEGWRDIQDSFRLATKYPVAGVNFYNLIPFPKTELFEWVHENGYLLRKPEEYLSSTSQFANEPCFYTPELSLSERKNAFTYANKISKKVKGNWVKRKFRKWGPLAYALSVLYTNESLNKLLRKERSIYRFVEIAKQLLLKERKL